jgi:DNA-binding NarL/FixJ family response regulator
MNNKPTIVIADDHPVFREGLRRVIERENAGCIVGEASDGGAAVRLVSQHKPDIALLDIAMPGDNGLVTARAIRRLRLDVALVFLTMFKEEDMFDEAMDLGAKGYVLKENAVNDLIGCLRAVAQGQYFISPAISHLLIRRTQRALGLGQQKAGLESLTPSERRILHLIARSMTSKEIATELFISPKTVENHRLNIMSKLDLHGNNALLRFALENRDKL